MQFLAIFFLSIRAAIVYGIAHDQVTARLCVEYFTVAHPPVFATHDPTLLALGWGTIATWWVGAILGLPLALAAQLGPWPRRSAASLLRPILVLLAVMACSALLAGTIGYLAAVHGRLSLREPFASRIPPLRHARFLADAFAHLASYNVGFLGGILLVLWVLVSRRRMARHPSSPTGS
jgi:hypothetical protein